MRMLKQKSIRAGVMLGLMLGFFSGGFASVNSDSVMKKLDFYGSVSIESGQLVNFKFGYAGGDFSHQWLQNDKLRLGLTTQVNPRLGGDVTVLGWLYYNTFPDSMMNDPSRTAKGAIVDYKIERAEMILNCSPNPVDKLLVLHLGMFPYEYNSDIRNLGEYLFRTGCYPGYIVSDGFDMVHEQIAGALLHNELHTVPGLESWSNDLLLTSELYLYPLNDFSLSYITNLKVNKIFDVGGGIQFYHCFPVSNDYTQPKIFENEHGLIPAPNWYIDTKGDTGYYTFAGTKLMGRFTVDFKPLIGISNLFGSEDLKLYGEAAILGVKDYPVNNVDSINQFGYNKLFQKMPMMLGVNLPGCKFLDLINLEVEYYGKQYVNRPPVVTQGLTMSTLPLPYGTFNSGEPEGSIANGAMGTGEYTKTTYFGGAAQWKWSIYLKKTLFNNFTMTMQFARDHSRVQTDLTESIDPEECMILDNQWYWMFKCAYNF